LTKICDGMLAFWYMASSCGWTNLHLDEPSGQYTVLSSSRMSGDEEKIEIGNDGSNKIGVRLGILLAAQITERRRARECTNHIEHSYVGPPLPPTYAVMQNFLLRILGRIN
jgi:hypothetical protein